MRFHYPVQPGFFFPGEGPQPALGTEVPWLDVGAGTPGTPINVNLKVHWPDSPALPEAERKQVATMKVGDTLVTAKDGLPTINGQCSVDLVYQPGVTDKQTDESFSGFVGNAPDQGPVTYKIWSGDEEVPPITLNWGDELLPVDEGWVDGAATIDDDTFTWTSEFAVYGDAVAMGSRIGFNIGGGAAKEEGAEGRDQPLEPWPGADSRAKEGSSEAENRSAPTG